jgi:carbonic anhydrase
MDALIDGYRRYRAARWPTLRAHAKSLAEGQSPEVLVIACCDSRVDPATIFDARPGELFVVRNVANLAPQHEDPAGHHGTSAAIEFAVEFLEVKTILVLGHARCGGVAAALARPARSFGAYLDPWVDLLEPAKARLPAQATDAQTLLEFESIKVTIENLRTFPFVAKREGDGVLRIAGARYGVANGRLEWLDPETGVFAEIE